MRFVRRAWGSWREEWGMARWQHRVGLLLLLPSLPIADLLQFLVDWLDH